MKLQHAPSTRSVRASDGSTEPWVWTGITSGPSKLGSGFPVAGWASGGDAHSWSGIAMSTSSNAHPLYAVSGLLHARQPVPILPAAALVSLLASLVVGARSTR